MSVVFQTTEAYRRDPLDARGAPRPSEKRPRAALAAAVQMVSGRFGVRRQSGAATALSKRRGGVERQSGVVVEGMVRGLGNADAFEKRCRAALAAAVQNSRSESGVALRLPPQSKNRAQRSRITHHASR